METENYAEIGKLLSSARQQLRLSSEQASSMLHIRVRYLEALEEGHLQELPGLTYTRGYLQSYAMFLGLDKDEILRRFEEVEAQLARRNFYFPQAFSRDKTPSPRIVWGSLGLAVVVYILWLLLLHPTMPAVSQVEKFPAPPKPKIKISIETMRDVTCLRETDVLYPPCTQAPKSTFGPVFNWLPVSRPHVTIMELGGPDSEETDDDADGN